MPLNVHKVTLETRRPGRADYWQALKDCLKADFAGAKQRLKREQWLVTYDANGNKLFGISGSENMSVFVGGSAEKPAAPPLPSEPVFTPEPVMTGKAIRVRKSPVVFKP